VFDTSRQHGAPRKLLDASGLAQLGWTARAELRASIASAYRVFLGARVR
jgi:hypothetical protein